MVFLKELFEKVDFEKYQQTTKKKHEKLPRMHRVDDDPLQANKKKKKQDFIPYRDSVLTWLLRENLGKLPR